MDSEPSVGIVRKFSDKFLEESPDSHLSRGLATKVEEDRKREKFPDLSPADQWSLLLSDASDWPKLIPTEEHILFEQSLKLRKAWDRFQSSLPKEQRQNFHGQRPDIKHLFNAVDKATKSWQQDRSTTKFGKLKRSFDSLCSKFQDHKNILSIVPKDDKYVCLLTGSLSTIAHASANHDKIATAVEESLGELAKDIDFWNRQMRAYQRKHGNIAVLNHYIVELYVIIFEFLTEIFDKWSKSGWARFKSSFDEGFFNRVFTEKRARMNVIGQRMAREVDLLRDTTLDRRLENMEASLLQVTEANQNILEFQKRHLELQSQLALTLGTHAQRFLQDQTYVRQFLLFCNSMQGNQARLESSDSTQHLEGEMLVSTPDTHSSAGSEASTEMISARSRGDVLKELDWIVQRYGEHMYAVADMGFRARRLRIDAHVQSELLRWIRTSKQARLWVRGPHGTPRPSQNTLSSVNLVALSKTSDIPFIAYFCAVRDDRNLQHLSRRQALLDMLLSIITQLLLVSADDIAVTALSDKQLTALKDRKIEVGEAHRLIRLLRASAPQFLHIVIDNIQSLEDLSDEEHTIDIINTVGTLCTLDPDEVNNDDDPYKSITRRNSFAPRFEKGSDADGTDIASVTTVTKVCFTTDGHADSLSMISRMKLLGRIGFDLEAGDPRADSVKAFGEGFK